MTSLPLIAVFMTVWASFLKALAVAVRPQSATCARCARPLERRHLGEAVCRCHC